MFKGCAALTRKLSKFVLYLTNFVFFVIGAVLIGISLYAHFTDWSKFFHKTLLLYSLIAGIVIIVVSLLGCFGVRTGKKRYLCPYTTFVLACFVLQVIAFALAYNFNGAVDKAKDLGFNETKYDSAEKKVMDYIQDQFAYVYKQGQCDFNVSESKTGAACKDAHWLEKFINTECTVNVTTDQQQRRFHSCLSNVTSALTVGTAGAGDAYCACQRSLTAKIEEYLGPVWLVSIAFAAFEFLLVTMACCRMCDDRTEERRRAELERQYQGNPSYAGQTLDANSYYIPPNEELQAQERAAQKGRAQGFNGVTLA